MKIVNVELLGHPVSVLTIIVLIVLFWFAIYRLSSIANLSETA